MMSQPQLHPAAAFSPYGAAPTVLTAPFAGGPSTSYHASFLAQTQARAQAAAMAQAQQAQALLAQQQQQQRQLAAMQLAQRQQQLNSMPTVHDATGGGNWERASVRTSDTFRSETAGGGLPGSASVSTLDPGERRGSDGMSLASSPLRAESVATARTHLTDVSSMSGARTQREQDIEHVASAWHLKNEQTAASVLKWQKRQKGFAQAKARRAAQNGKVQCGRARVPHATNTPSPSLPTRSTPQVRTCQAHGAVTSSQSLQQCRCALSLAAASLALAHSCSFQPHTGARMQKNPGRSVVGSDRSRAKQRAQRRRHIPAWMAPAAAEGGSGSDNAVAGVEGGPQEGLKQFATAQPNNVTQCNSSARVCSGMII